MRRTITACAFMYPLASSLLVFLFSEPALRRYNACEPVGMPHATLVVAGVERGGSFLLWIYRRGRTSLATLRRSFWILIIRSYGRFASLRVANPAQREKPFDRRWQRKGQHEQQAPPRQRDAGRSRLCPLGLWATPASGPPYDILRSAKDVSHGARALSRALGAGF